MDTLRKCIVKGNNAYFHIWVDREDIFPPSPMRGGHPGGQIKYAVAIVEYENGQVHECFPDEIRFLESQKSVALNSHPEESEFMTVGYDRDGKEVKIRRENEYVR